MPDQLELGLDTFGDVTLDVNGSPLPQAQVIRNVVEEAVLADELGLDFVGVGEHHRADFAVSAPEVVLAAVAGRTSRIHLGSAVTVLSSDDPVRVFQRFSTLDAVSGGRAEVILGRGSFIESFPLFGFPLEKYNLLFEEKLELFVTLLEQRPVTWKGTTRPPLEGQRIFPPTESRSLKTWVGVGGSPDSVVRAARYGLPLVLAVIGGEPLRFKPLVELYHRSLKQFGKGPQAVAMHCPGYVAATDEQARDEMWPHYAAMHARIGRERGWAPMTRAQFDATAGPDGALFVGSPETVAAKIVKVARALDLSRFDLKYSTGTLPHEQLMRCIELYGSEVAPVVREQLSPRAEVATTVGVVADEAAVDQALTVVLDELITAIHETKQAVWLTSDVEQHRALEALRQFLVEQATAVGAAEARIDGRSPLLVSPGARRWPDLAARAGREPAAMLRMLTEDLQALLADLRQQAQTIAGREEAQILLRLADGLEHQLAALRG